MREQYRNKHTPLISHICNTGTQLCNSSFRPWGQPTPTSKVRFWAIVYGYLFKLYGMCIGWKATRQRSITKSTTEAELIALSVAGVEMEWWNRVFKHVKFSPNVRPAIFCDNEQTVGIVSKQDDRLHTKLRHVDTHQMWLRQEVQHEHLHVVWCSTADMPADGFTKSLIRQKHDRFVKQLGPDNIERYMVGSTPDAEVPDTVGLAEPY